MAAVDGAAITASAAKLAAQASDYGKKTIQRDEEEKKKWWEWFLRKQKATIGDRARDSNSTDRLVPGNMNTTITPSDDNMKTIGESMKYMTGAALLNN